MSGEKKSDISSFLDKLYSGYYHDKDSDLWDPSEITDDYCIEEKPSCSSKIEKSKFIVEHCLFSALPYFLKICLGIVYLAFGTFVFRTLDPGLSPKPYHEVFLFSFTTLTTIGYGNLVPTTQETIVFSVLYICCGVPAVFLVLSSFGKLISEFYWILVTVIRRKNELVTDNPQTIPPHVGMILLHGHSVIGAILFKYWLMPELSFIDAYYLSYISITTIGFGDISPVPASTAESITLLVYLSIGIVILSAFVNSLIQVIRRLHYIGRTFSGAQHVGVYFAGARFTIRELLELVSLQFNVSPQQVKEVIYELDELINLHDQNAGKTSFDASDSNNNDADDALPSPASDYTSPRSQTSTTSKMTNYTSRFSDAEQLRLIRAVSTICHLSDTGNRSFKSSSPSPLITAMKSAPTTPIR